VESSPLIIYDYYFVSALNATSLSQRTAL